MSDVVEREITIKAPIGTVWKVITNPSQWFGDKADLELKPGGKGTVSWDDYGDAPMEVVKLDEPSYFSFAWIGPDEETRGTGQQTLVEFTLSEDGESTKLHLTESIYDKQLMSDEQKESLFGKRSGGWGYFTGIIKQQAEDL
jgi:uncharacterized protein YndB with AHSA1/START domain